MEASGTALWSCENQLVLDTWVGREKDIPGRKNMGDMLAGIAMKKSWTKTGQGRNHKDPKQNLK